MASDASGDLEQQELPQGGRHWTAARGDRERAPRGGRHKARDFLALQALIALIINIHSDPLAPQNLNPGQDSTRRTDDTGGHSTRNSSPGPQNHHRGLAPSRRKSTSHSPSFNPGADPAFLPGPRVNELACRQQRKKAFFSKSLFASTKL